MNHRLETSEAEYDTLSSRLNGRIRDLEAMVETARTGDGDKQKVLDSLDEHVVVTILLSQLPKGLVVLQRCQCDLRL